MSRANIDLVRSIYADWERGEYRSALWAHPEIEFVVVGGPSPGSWNGVPGMAEGWRAVISAFDGYRSVAEEHRELDDQRVLVLTRGMGRGKASGAPVEHAGAALFHVHDGKVTRHVTYPHRERAIADLGLEA